MSVNVYTEWGKLKEVIVGNSLSSDKINVDLSFRLFYNEHIKDNLVRNSITLQKKIVEQRQEDLDNLSNTLKDLGVVVKRPKLLEQSTKFSTPAFEDYTRSHSNPRDLTLIVGDEIIETPMMVRGRYFENDLIKDILLEYFNSGARWTVAPRPRLTDSSFDPAIKNNPPQDDVSSLEIMFDAAQCLKFGKDIVMNVSNKNHELGAQWLSRHLGDRYRVHTVSITDYHIDGMFIPLRPGTLLINPYTMSDKVHLLPKALQRWDILTLPESEISKPSSDDVYLASENIDVNVLPIDENRVIIFDSTGVGNPKLIKLLEENKFEPIPVRLRHSRIFDGGVHCVTLDTVREDTLEDYFS